MSALDDHIRDLVIANRILAHEGVVDAFGHATVRHPDKPDHYLMSVSRAPELITADDIATFTLDGEGIDLGDRMPYGERAIHGGIYEARPDVNAVIHNHSYAVIPFGITETPIRPVAHVCAPIGGDIPVWDIRDTFGETNHLVTTMEHGRELAAFLGDRTATLMKRHGCVVVGPNIREAVMSAVYLQVNATLQLQALQLGTPDFLTPTEIDLCTERQTSPLGLNRAWEYWCQRAGAGV